MKSLTLYISLSLFILSGCSKDTEGNGSIVSSEDNEPYLMTITNNSKDADLLLWCESDYLKYNQTSDIIKGYKDTAEIAFRWSNKIYDGITPWDTVKFVMKNKREVNNFKINK